VYIEVPNSKSIKTKFFPQYINLREEGSERTMKEKKHYAQPRGQAPTENKHT